MRHTLALTAQVGLVRSVDYGLAHNNYLTVSPALTFDFKGVPKHLKD